MVRMVRMNTYAREPVCGVPGRCVMMRSRMCARVDAYHAYQLQIFQWVRVFFMRTTMRTTMRTMRTSGGAAVGGRRRKRAHALSSSLVRSRKSALQWLCQAVSLS